MLSNLHRLIMCLNQCEKHSKKEEALAKLREGAKFDEVAREFSEDKARQGMAEFPFTSENNRQCIATASRRTRQSDRLTWTNSYQSGGALGWKTRGSLHGDFEKVAYDLEPSTTANPKCE